MKFNVDCARDVLLQIEKASFNEYYTMDELHKLLPEYETYDIMYTCLKLCEAGIIHASIEEIDNLNIPYVQSVYDITYRGHNFLAKTRDEDRWKGIKKALPSIRDYSLDAINSVANGFASAAISSYFSHQV